MLKAVYRQGVGKKNYRTEVVADRVQFGPRSGGSGATANADTGASQNKAPSGSDSQEIEYPQEEINPDDIPF